MRGAGGAVKRFLVVGAAMASMAAACDQGPDYDLNLVLPLTRDGGVVDAQLSTGTSNLTLFPCDVSIRLGQCKDARPFQLVLVPAGQDQSGTTNCGTTTARAILQDGVGTSIPLGRSDGGLLWIQAFHGDDDDGSGLVDRVEMNAYAEMTRGTVTVNSFDGQTLEAVVDSEDPVRGGAVSGTLGAIDGDSTGTPGVGPRCTWPIGATAN